MKSVKRKVGSPVFFRSLVLHALVLGSIPFAAHPAEAQVPPPEAQVSAALLAAPESQREEATVLGYDAEGQLATLRSGRGALTCLADDPRDPGFSVACYHTSLDAYMARGRELAGQGVTDPTERYHIRWKEADEGKLAMPESPATLFVLTGSGYDPAEGTVSDPYLRYVVYVPWATVESTGLPDRPLGPGSPWLMYPGTAGAHIMISPPKPSGS